MGADGPSRVPSGPKGDRGDRGERGEEGLSRRTRQALIYLFAVAAGLALVALAAVWQQSRHNADVQRQQAQMLELKLCTTLGRLAALRPPAGDPVGNPSRKYEQDLHGVLSELGPDLGCR